MPHIKIIMLTVHDEDENLLQALKRGADGFLSKKVRTKNLLDSLRGIMKGETAIPEPMADKILKEPDPPAEIEADYIASHLTPREKEMLQKISEGLGNKEIGLSLYISENTVKVHVSSILRKLHVRTRAEAAAYAQRWGSHEEGG